MDLGISGRVAVATGAKSGMGRSTAEHPLREGVHDVLTDDAIRSDTALGRIWPTGDAPLSR
ncbi:hypothetical protein [Methylobacterium sp. NFXW15]|uniref:hypothetical protein n=1 Tax=Methylobacterium sp. NFXW15 TaxID=2819512 RepID=UPI003CEF3E49